MANHQRYPLLAYELEPGDLVIRRIAFWVLGIAGVAVLALCIFAVALTQMDLRQRIESTATAMLGRQVGVGGISVGWGNPIRIDVTQFRLANPGWGSTPDMVTAGRIGAEIALWPLLRGALSLSHVVVDDPVIVLERDPAGTGNWVFSNKAPPSPTEAGSPKPPPVQFIAGLQLQNGKLTFRTTKQHLLLVTVGTATLQAADVDAPVILHAEGAYNGLPLILDTRLGSFADLGRIPLPVPTDITVAAKHSKIRFQGTMTDPIGFDGIAGEIDLTAASTQDLTDAFGAAGIQDTQLNLKGKLNKQGNSWRLTGLTGELTGQAVAGTLGLDEGKRGQPDHFDIDLDFTRLDLQRLAGGPPSKGQPKGISLNVAEHPDETYRLRIGAKEAVYGRYRMDALGIAGSLEPGKVTLEKLSFGFADGRVEMSGTNEAAGVAGHLRLNASLSQGNAARLLAMAGSDATLAGRLNAGATLEMTGRTTEDGLADSRGQAVLSMTGGQITRQALELASIDVRLLLRKGQGFASVVCLLAVADMKNGIASIAPMRLRTREGNVSGGGQLDLRRSYVDLYLQSEGKSTQFWALDIPVHITGSFTNPAVQPMILSRMPAWGGRGSENLRSLPSALRQVADTKC
jgi:uncharacterized protein involved in outer membrane biogenesis